ncbi:hypothetical protein BD769DRAFT_1438253 [Suillus cothurnatus]|nr:hypothetical protein BD769DRAFT_1438253 [Suillus cothurnatus]
MLVHEPASIYDSSTWSRSKSHHSKSCASEPMGDGSTPRDSPESDRYPSNSISKSTKVSNGGRRPHTVLAPRLSPICVPLVDFTSTEDFESRLFNQIRVEHVQQIGRLSFLKIFDCLVGSFVETNAIDKLSDARKTGNNTFNPTFLVHSSLCSGLSRNCDWCLSDYISRATSLHRLSLLFLRSNISRKSMARVGSMKPHCV